MLKIKNSQSYEWPLEELFIGLPVLADVPTAGRNKKPNLKKMKAMIYDVQIDTSSDKVSVLAKFLDNTNNNSLVEDNNVDLTLSTLDFTDQSSYRKAIVSAFGAYHSYGLTASDIIGLPDTASLAVSNPSRSLNSAFQISATRDANVNYTVDIAATLSLTTGQSGTVALKYADDSGMTTNVVTVQSSVNGNSGTLAIGLGLTQTATAALSGIIPAGKYVKLVTTNTTGTPTFTMRAAQEVLL